MPGVARQYHPPSYGHVHPRLVCGAELDARVVGDLAEDGGMDPGEVAEPFPDPRGAAGLMCELAKALAPYSTRVNTVKPVFVATSLSQSDTISKLSLPGSLNRSREEFMTPLTELNSPLIPWVGGVDLHQQRGAFRGL